MSVFTYKRIGSPAPLQLWVGNDICSCLCTIFHNGKATVMWVDNVETHPSARRQGHGSSLMKYVIALAKKYRVDAIELVVNADNGVAKHLYRQAGFQCTQKEHLRIILNTRSGETHG